MANFTIVEATDASYLTITDTRVITTYSISVQCDAMTETTELTISLDAGQITDLATGLVLDPSEFGYSDTLYADGIYSFTVKYGGADEPYTVGFANIITGDVMKNSLEYRTYLDTKTKDWIDEQNRLLTNLQYAAQVGSTTHYLDNLEALQALQ